MAEIHGLAAQVTLILIVLTGGSVLLLAATRRALAPLLVGGLVWAVIMVVVTGLLGAALALTEQPPRDPLHVVYGLLAVAVLPGAWAIARSRDDARRTVVVLAIASIVLLILVFRLFQTGG